MAQLVIYSLVLALLGLGSASKCPEPRKPHPTSCAIFYNCINLPGGGYVWAPAKCTDGLVFQPYLRICVLPGDSWTCDILATDPPETTIKQIPDLIDSTQTSYLGYGEDDVSRFGEPLDFYKEEKYTEPLDTVQPTVTPYPLIEVTQPSTYTNQIDSTIQNLGVPIAIKHSEDNYLYHFVNGQHILATPVNANADQIQAHLQHLTELLERLTAYQALGIPLDRQPPSTTTTTTTTTPSPSTRSPIEYNKNYDINGNQESALLNFLVKNYVLSSQAAGTKSLSNSEATRTAVFDDQETTTRAADTERLLKSGTQASDNIVMVKDGLNNHQYFTINKYKSIAYQLTSEMVELLPCTSGVRLANSTDCTKYYSCEPDTAKVHQYICPSNTAFNKHKRLCERSEYIQCVVEADNTARNTLVTVIPRSRESSILSSDANPCQNIGKNWDPTSEKHYYICYTDKQKSADLLYHRMACPNSLIFCQGKNVCTTRKRCESV